MALKPLPSQMLLLQLLRYEPETGKLYWRERPASMFPNGHTAATWNSKNAGNEAFPVNPLGYGQSSIFKVLYRAHRVIWKMVYGVEALVIDHIDGDSYNNRLANLRSVTKSENGQNAKVRVDNTSGVAGVFWERGLGKWRARIKIRGRNVNLGVFETLEDAIGRRRAAEIEFGFHPNHGKR